MGRMTQMKRKPFEEASSRFLFARFALLVLFAFILLKAYPFSLAEVAPAFTRSVKLSPFIAEISSKLSAFFQEKVVNCPCLFFFGEAESYAYVVEEGVGCRDHEQREGCRGQQASHDHFRKRDVELSAFSYAQRHRDQCDHCR